MTENKFWYHSKTLWVNIISLLIVIIGTMAGWQEMRDYAPTLMAVVNGLNIVLRLVTYEGIK
jgi:uncharacterized membrane protein